MYYESKLRQLNVCWNDAFRKIFGFKRYESVKELQCLCSEMSLHYIYYLARRNFVIDLQRKNNTCLSVLSKIVLSYVDDSHCNEQTFGKLKRSRYNRREIVFSQFVLSLC